MNLAALAALVGQHGVQLRRFPADIEQRARGYARDVLQQFDRSGGLDARIYQSYTAMLEGVAPWSEVSVEGFLAARRDA
jgi:TRAP-type mannitol/chloroaromatic compound transport system substrate-binding protein